MDGNTFVDADGKPVLIMPGNVTSFADAPADDAVSAGGTALAASLSDDRAVLNVAFVTGRGDAQIIQLNVVDLAPTVPAKAPGEGDTESSDPAADAPPDGDDGAVMIVSGHLTTLSGAAISAGAGEATSVAGIAVAAGLDDRGDLRLSFVDGDGHLQLIETNVAELVRAPNAEDLDSAATAPDPADSGTAATATSADGAGTDDPPAGD